jgi:hypothetical protein
LADYEGCSIPSLEFSRKIGRTEVSWKVLDDCSVPVEYSWGIAQRIKARQANPIFKFLVTSEVGPLGAEIEIPVAMGEYVPELDTGIAFLEEMIDSLANQSEKIGRLASKKCFNAYSDPGCLVR